MNLSDKKIDTFNVTFTDRSGNGVKHIDQVDPKTLDATIHSVINSALNLDIQVERIILFVNYKEIY